MLVCATVPPVARGDEQSAARLRKRAHVVDADPVGADGFADGGGEQTVPDERDRCAARNVAGVLTHG